MSKLINRALFLSLMVLGNSPSFLSSQQVAAPQQQLQQQDQNIKAAATAANTWLGYVDQGKYGESWDAGALTFQFTISRNEWIKAMKLARQPFGQVVSRELIKQDPAQNPKNLPAGAYMVNYYKTSFSNRPDAHERLILQQQNNGQWKMLTYDFN